MVEKISEQKQSQSDPLYSLNDSENSQLELPEETECASELARWGLFHGNAYAPVTQNGRAARTV
jgi:hypothetical protein